jgi:hypothetical protein
VNARRGRATAAVISLLQIVVSLVLTALIYVASGRTVSWFSCRSSRRA